MHFVVSNKYVSKYNYSQDHWNNGGFCHSMLDVIQFSSSNRKNDKALEDYNMEQIAPGSQHE